MQRLEVSGAVRPIYGSLGVKRLTLSWKWKHGTSRSGMPCFIFVLNSVTAPPQHMENFSRHLETMQCQEHMPFSGTKCFLKVEPVAYREGGLEGSNPPEIPEALQNRAKLNLIVKNVKNA